MDLNNIKNYFLQPIQNLQKLKPLFSVKPEEKISLLPEDQICCQVTAVSYRKIVDRPSALGDWLLIDDFFNEEKHCIYVNHSLKTVILGYRGTIVTNIKDLMSDVQIILWVATIDERVKESLMVYDSLREKFPDYKKRICWHSLGGTICYIVAKHRIPDRCTVFNPWSSLNQLFVQMLTNTIQGLPRTQQVYTYKILWDPVSLFSFVGTTKIFTVPKVDPLALHALNNFVSSLP